MNQSTNSFSCHLFYKPLKTLFGQHLFHGFTALRDVSSVSAKGPSGPSQMLLWTQHSLNRVGWSSWPLLQPPRLSLWRESNPILKWCGHNQSFWWFLSSGFSSFLLKTNKNKNKKTQSAWPELLLFLYRLTIRMVTKHKHFGGESIDGASVLWHKVGNTSRSCHLPPFQVGGTSFAPRF